MMDEVRCDGVCIPECRFYPECGRIEDEEVLCWYEDKLYSEPVGAAIGTPEGINSDGCRMEWQHFGHTATFCHIGR